jgi:hypothetical protein
MGGSLCDLYKRGIRRKILLILVRGDYGGME